MATKARDPQPITPKDEFHDLTVIHAIPPLSMISTPPSMELSFSSPPLTPTIDATWDPSWKWSQDWDTDTGSFNTHVHHQPIRSDPYQDKINLEMMMSSMDQDIDLSQCFLVV